MRKDNKVHTDMRISDGSPNGTKHEPNRPELPAGCGLPLMVDRMTCGRFPKKGEPAIVSDGKGMRYWCKRSRSLAATWLEIDAFNWIDGNGWDQLPVKRRETLEAIDKAMKEQNL